MPVYPFRGVVGKPSGSLDIEAYTLGFVSFSVAPVQACIAPD